MTPRALFNIILKIFGLFFLREIINSIPGLITSFFYIASEGIFGEGIKIFLFSAIIIGFYTFLVLKLLFHTNDIVNLLKLDQGFGEESFSWNITSSQILTVGLLIMVGTILIHEIPYLFKQIFSYFQQKGLLQGVANPELSNALMSAVKIVIAFLIIGERKRIIAFVEDRNLNEQEEEKEFQDPEDISS